jgi:hypothetical protein
MDQYWASKPTEEIGAELMKKVEEYQEYLRNSGVMDELRESYKAFYGSTSLGEAGAQGELTAIEVNHYASLVRSIHTMVTSQRPSWEPRATNTDVKSQAQCILAAGLLDYYSREKRMERYTDMALLTALILKEAWISTTWDANAGEVHAVDPDTEQPIMEGDIEYRLFRMNEVIRDVNRGDNKHNWLGVEEWVNKYDEAAKYPDKAEQILALSTETNLAQDTRLRPIWVGKESKESDLIRRYTFYFEKSPALPNGRIVTLYSREIVVMDGPLPYRRIPVRNVSIEEMIEAAFGHSPTFDLLSLQKAINILFSTVVTNAATFGVQNIMVPKGSDMSVSQLTGGLNLIEYDPKLGPPQALNLLQTPKEIYDGIQLLIESQQTLSGVNAVARGNASPQLSGAAMALLQATALQFSSAAQKASIRIVEDVGTDTIHCLSDFATTKRVAYIVGKHNRSMLKEFQGDDVADISRVTVDSANSLTKTIAGRTEIANQLLNAGQIQRPEQYLTLIQTGQLEPMYENETSELLLIRSENEDLAEGKSAIAVATDVHALHILEHKSVLSSPEARRDPKIVQTTLDHIQQHITALQTVDPMLLQLTGQQSMAPQMAPPGPMPQGPAPVGQPAGAAGVPMPDMPTNPMTGEKAQGQPPQA